jgi:ACS family glucarate transporter-like MFS transporter
MMPSVLRNEPVSVQSPSVVRYWVLALLCLATTTAYIDRGCISVMETAIRADLDFDKDTMGTVMSSFFVVYALFQVPAAWLAHVWGTRRALSFYSIIWSIATGASALVSGFVGLTGARVMMGLAEAGMIPASADAVSKWFPLTRRARATGILAGFQGVGAMLGALATGLLLKVHVSWRWIFALYAFPGILWSLWFYWWYRDYPREHASVNDAERELIEQTILAGEKPTASASDKGHGATSTPWREILTNGPLWAMNVQQFCRAGAFAFYITWCPTFLQKTRGADASDAGVLVTFAHVTTLLGATAGGFVSDWLLVRTGRRWIARQGVGAVALLACVLFMLPAYFVADMHVTALLLAASAFCSAMAGPCVFAFTIDLGGKHVAPVFGVMNMLGNLGAAAFAKTVPWVVDGAGWNHVLTFVMILNGISAGFWLITADRGPIGAGKAAEPVASIH